jgi:hypothetical protein
MEAKREGKVKKKRKKGEFAAMKKKKRPRANQCTHPNKKLYEI